MRLVSNSAVKRIRRRSKNISKAVGVLMETLDRRVLLSATTLSSYSSVVTDIEVGGAASTKAAYVNGTFNSALTGAYQYQAFAVVEFDPSNSTIYPNTTFVTPPTTAAGLTTTTTGGTLPANTKYYVEYTFTNANGETTPGGESFVTTGAGATNLITLAAPTLPHGATGYNVYVGTASGAEQSSGTGVVGTAFKITAAASSTANVPPNVNSARVSSSSNFIAAPTVTPVLTTNTTGGSLAANTYFVDYTFTSPAGETTAGGETSIVVPTGTTTNIVNVPAPTLPVGATAFNVYVGTATGAERLSGAGTAGTAYKITALPASNAAVPSNVNTTSNFNISNSANNVSTISLTLINNPDAYNSRNGSTGDLSTGGFDVYLLPTYTTPLGATSLAYSTATVAGLPLGLQGQGGLSSVGTASNFLLTPTPFTAPNPGPVAVTLTLPEGPGANAYTVLNNDLNTDTKFELAIVPDTATSAAHFQGEVETTTSAQDSNTTPEANGLNGDATLDESPLLSLNSSTGSTVSESISVPYSTITVNQDNASAVAEIDVQRNGYAGDSVSVNYTLSNGTGTFLTDYGDSTNGSSGTVTFAANQTEAVIPVTVIDTGGAPDKTFNVALSPTGLTGGTNVTLSPAVSSTVTIVGTANEADVIGGPTFIGNNIQRGNDNSTMLSASNGFTVSASASSVQIAVPFAGTYAAVNGAVTNGPDQFNTQQFTVMSFNANGLAATTSSGPAPVTVNTLTSLSLVLDNYNSSEGMYADTAQGTGTTVFSGPNPVHVGNFNVYLLNSSVTSTPTAAFGFEGQDVNSSGVYTQGTPILLGTASFSDQITSNSPVTGNLNIPEGVQDIYTLELNPAAQAILKADLNSTSTLSPGTIRLAVAAGTSAFAADFANSNSQKGGNYGIQPYLWLDGTTSAAVLPAERFAINYQNISVNSNESEVVVDIARSSAFTGDTATVNFSLTDGTAKLGTDYTAPSSYSVTISPTQTIATVVIPLIAKTNTVEKTFTMTLTGASSTLDTGPYVDTTDPTTITITPPLAVPTTPVVSDNTGAAETPATSLFNGYAYLNGSSTNGTGSLAFQGFQVIEFTPSQFINAGQQISSLTNLSLGLGNYENQQSTPGSNYGGPAGNFTLYVAGTDESAFEQQRPTQFNAASASGGDPAVYNPATTDGIGGFNTSGSYVNLNSSSPGPLGLPTGSTPVPLNSTTTSDFAIPIGVVSFNTKLGLDYYTPTQAALNKQYTITNPLTGTGTVTESALQLIQSQINAGQNIRLLAGPGNSAFHAYFWGANPSGAAGTGGPEVPQLLIADTVTVAKTYETVGFTTSSYTVDTNAGLVTIPVARNLLDNLPANGGLADTLTVSYATADGVTGDGNATNGTNYTSESGVLTFGPGVATQLIEIPITNITSLGGDKAFTISLTSPSTNGVAASYATPTLATNSTTTVFIADNASNGQTLTQYSSSPGEGDIGTGGPVTFGTSSLNPVPPFNFSVKPSSTYAALDFNDSSVINYNDPGEFNSATGPIGTVALDSSGDPIPYNYSPTNLNASGANTTNNTQTDPNLGIGQLTYTPAGDGSIYNSTISALNEVSLNFVNYYGSTAGALLNVYLVQDATSNIGAGAAGTGKNPHYFNTSLTGVAGTSNINSALYVGAVDGVGNQFGTMYTLGTILNPASVNYGGYVSVPLTEFNTTAEGILVADLNTGTKFRLIVAPESTTTQPTPLADWVYGYSNSNATYAVANGFPINYYIQPDLSFDVTYAVGANTVSSYTLPSYITPSANADYIYDPTTNNLTVTNGSLTIGADTAAVTTIGQLHITASGAAASVIIDTPQITAASVATNSGGTVVPLVVPVWLVPAGGAVYSWDLVTQHLQIYSGSATIISDPNAAGNVPYVNVTGATSSLTINSVSTGVRLAGLALQGGATATLSTGGSPQVLFLSPGVFSLTIDSTSKLNIGNNIIDLQNGLLAATNTSLLSLITADVTTGYHNGLWNGVGGIDSTVAAADTTRHVLAIGVALETQYAGTTLDTQTPNSFDVLVRQTYYGDANLDGHVDGSDYSKIDYSYINPQTGWANGDFNYDTKINGSDYTLIDNAFNQQSAPLAAPTAVASPLATVAAKVSAKTFATGHNVAAVFAGLSSQTPTSGTSFADLLKHDKSNVLLASSLLDSLHAS